MIHYHGTPLTGVDMPILELQSRHACVSFARPEQIEVAAELCQSFILDNGAFSTWKSGRSFDLRGFASFAALWTKHPGCDWYLIPDVINGSEEDNRRMQDEWLSLVDASTACHGVPVWHMHESMAWLDYLVDRHDRIALGSSGQWATVGTRSWWDRMADAMRVACDADGAPRARLHGLRMLDPTIFSHLPLSSADSTNVARNIGIDQAWSGAYAPRSRRMRAAILMERIESHASARRWSGSSAGCAPNRDLFG